MKTRNQDIAMMILEKINPNNSIKLSYNSEADSIDVYRFINNKESEGRHLKYLDDDQEACTFYEEVVEWIDSEENDVIENIDYQQELFAEHEKF